MGLQAMVDAAAPGSAVEATDEILAYPVIIDKDLTIRGPANIRSGNSGGSVFIGLQRSMLSVPNPLDPTKVGYRTNNDRRIWLPAEPWRMSPPVTIKLGIVINSMPAGQVALFGAIERQLPAPLFCFMDPTSISVWSASGKFSCLFPWKVGYHEVLVQIGTTTTIVVDGVALSPFYTSACSVSNPIRTPSFGIGGVANGMTGWADLSGGSHDFTYCGLIAAAGIVPITSFWQNFNPAPFCHLMCDAGSLVHCFGTVGPAAHTYGAMVLVNQGFVPTPTFENVQFNTPFYVGGCSHPQFWKCFFGQGFTCPGAWTTYPIDLDGCTVQGLYRGCKSITWMDRCLIDRMEFHASRVTANKGFMRGISGFDNYIECLEGGMYSFESMVIDDENKYGPPGSYFYAEKGLGPQLLQIDNCVVGTAAGKGDVLSNFPAIVNGLRAWGRTPTVDTFA